MELKYVIPNMEKTFGQLEYAGEGNIEQRRINGRPTILSRSYNLYSTIQRADDIVVILPEYGITIRPLVRNFRPSNARKKSTECERGRPIL